MTIHLRPILAKNCLKTPFLVLFALGNCFLANSQTLSPSVISADGGRISTPVMTIDWTIGETFTDAYLVNSGMISEGFQQPILKVENVVLAAFELEERSVSDQNDRFSMNCWPNPVSEILNVRINAENLTTTTIQLLNEKCQTIEQMVQNSNIDFEISMRNYPNGQYFLQILNPAGQLIGSKKITLVR
jgi:hypothetical protein